MHKHIQKRLTALLFLIALLASFQTMAANPFTGGRVRFFTNLADGAIEPLAGGLVYTYDAGTTTPKETYTTSEGDVANTNPVVLDSEGYADIYLGSGNYKIDVKTAAGVSLPGYPVDDIEGTVFLLDAITASSSTSVALALGEKVLEIEANKALPDNAWVLISYDGDPADHYMIGQVTDYTGVYLTVDVTQIEGSGTYNDWTIALSGPPGPDGPQGPTGAGTGDMLGANNLSDVASATTSRANLGLGSAATLDVGTTANKVVQLDSNAKIPAIDGSQITNLTATNIASGTVPTARLGSGTANSSSFLRGDQTWQSTSSIIPTAAQGVGTYVLATSSAAVAAGATVSGTNLKLVSIEPDGGQNEAAGSLTGTWRNMGNLVGASSPEGRYISLWVRTE
jgi:hypothetical protein